MDYEIKAGTKLTKNDLYDGRTVCLADVNTNPNNVGVLSKHLNNGTFDYWTATINNITYRFDNSANCLDDEAIVLYSLVLSSGISLDIQSTQEVTRDNGVSVVTTTLSSLIPKDQFAICALEALISTIPNSVSMDDATILMLAIKAYKISQAMLYVGSMARAADAASSELSGDAAPVDAANLTDNTEKILYNINETLKAIKTQDASQHTSGLKISTITPTVKIDNPTNDKLEIEGGGGGSSLNRDDVNNTETITDVLVYNTGVGKAPLRSTLLNFGKKILSTLKLDWLIKKGTTDITSASTFFTQYADDIASVLSDKFDAKGAANSALASAKQYADDNFVKK